MKKLKTFSCSFSPRQFFWTSLGILLLATLLRFYQLGNIPHGMTWDEAAIGYNGYAVFTTRRDEWLKRLPISFWSFGDYKAPLAIYINGFSTFIFGMNLFAVRFPFAVAGVLAILGMILFLRSFLEDIEQLSPSKARFWAVVGGGFLMLSPWHLHYSRAGFESGMALSFVVWGLYFWQKFWGKFTNIRNYNENEKYVGWWLVFSVISFIASIYTYHSAKIMVPILGLVLLWQRRLQLKKVIKEISISSVLGGLLLLPFLYDSFFGKGLERAGTLIFSQGLSFVELIKTIGLQTLAHLDPRFIFLGKTTTLRHGDGQWGVLLFTTGIVCLYAIVFFLKKRLSKRKNDLEINGFNKLFSLSLLLIATGLLPAIIGTEVPHSNRSLLALPGFILLAITGLQLISKISSEVIKRSLLGTLLLIHLVIFSNYLHDYYYNFSRESAASFQDGYLEAFEYVIPYEKGLNDKPIVDKIIFTSDYGQPYIYALFARKTNPIWYQGGSLIKFEFKDEVTIGDLERKNTIVVASNEDELLSKNDQADHIVYGSDGSIRFRIYLNLER